MRTVIFKNPPITEALLDIRVTLTSDFDVSNFEKFYKAIRSEFPNKQTNTRWETAFQLKKGEKPVVTSKDSTNGFLYKTSDGGKIVQARVDGFTFNKLKPYSNWDTFNKEARKLWELYVNITKPVNITRVALRYINLVEIPLPIKDFKDYFLTGPEVAPGLPQGLSEFFIRLVVPDPATHNVAIITETVDQSKLNEKILPLIFDIDVFRLMNITADDKRLWEIFESLRMYKDKVFMSSFTDKAKELFE